MSERLDRLESLMIQIAERQDANTKAIEANAAFMAELSRSVAVTDRVARQHSKEIREMNARNDRNTEAIKANTEMLVTLIKQNSEQTRLIVQGFTRGAEANAHLQDQIDELKG